MPESSPSCQNPTPGVTLVFEATRWDFDGDDKTKTERVRKFYGAIPEVVEFRRFSADEARQEAFEELLKRPSQGDGSVLRNRNSRRWRL